MTFPFNTLRKLKWNEMGYMKNQRARVIIGKISAGILTLMLVGCNSTHPKAAITAEQAGTIAMQLANDKAFSLYHCRPFQGGQPARFETGHWIWFTRQGFGHADFEAQVELAANGAANKSDCGVMVNIFDSREY
jgi:hypothetical protein